MPMGEIAEGAHSFIQIIQKEENRPATHSKNLLQVPNNLLVWLTGIKDLLVLHHQ